MDSRPDQSCFPKLKNKMYLQLDIEIVKMASMDEILSICWQQFAREKSFWWKLKRNWMKMLIVTNIENNGGRLT